MSTKKRKHEANEQEEPAANAEKKAKTAEEEKKTKKQKEDDEYDSWRCPICAEWMSAPIYQCTNGHCICGVCYHKPNFAKCAECGVPYMGRPSTNIRNRALEFLARKEIRECAYGCGICMPIEELNEVHGPNCPQKPLFCSYCDTDKMDRNALVVHLIKEHRAKKVETPREFQSDCTFSSDKERDDWLFVFESHIQIQVCYFHNRLSSTVHVTCEQFMPPPLSPPSSASSGGQSSSSSSSDKQQQQQRADDQKPMMMKVAALFLDGRQTTMTIPVAHYRFHPSPDHLEGDCFVAKVDNRYVRPMPKNDQGHDRVIVMKFQVVT